MCPFERTAARTLGRVRGEPMDNGNRAGEGTKNALPEKVARWDIAARGDVQRVGYRDFVDGIVTAMGLGGAVWNDSKDQHMVHIDVQGPETKLPPFVDAISGKHGLIDARDVQRVSEKDVDPSLTTFSQRREEPLVELAEATTQGARALNVLIGIGTETLATSKENLSISKENLSISKETLAIGKDTLKAVQEVGRKVDNGNQEMRKGFHDSIASSEHLHKEFTVRFDRVDTAYGTIGKTLARMDKNLEKLTKAILSLAQESHRAAKESQRASRPVARQRPTRSRH